MMALPKYSRVKYRGVETDAFTKAAALWAERKAGFPFSPSQGSYTTGVVASGTSHAGGGSLDWSCRWMTPANRIKMVHALKDAGFAVWWRPPNWDGRGGAEHVHGQLINNAKASPSAKSQWAAYDKKRNGLNNNAYDGTYRPSPPVRFDYSQDCPLPRKAAA